MQERKVSFFGEKVDGMVKNAQEVASNLEFSNKVEDTINELWGVISLSINSVVTACDKELGKDIDKDEDDIDSFSPYSPEYSYEDIPEEPEEISIDQLIAQSNTYGKPAEQVANEFRDDLKDTIRHYAWLLVALGIALDHEEKREIIAILKGKSKELAIQAKELKIREEVVANMEKKI